MLEEELNEITLSIHEQKKFHTKLAGQVADPKLLELQYIRRQKQEARFARIGLARFVEGTNHTMSTNNSQEITPSITVNKKDNFFTEIHKAQRVFPLNMTGKNTHMIFPKQNNKDDDIERTLRVSHVEEMPTKYNNYYQDLLRKNKIKRISMPPSPTANKLEQNKKPFFAPTSPEPGSLPSYMRGTLAS